MGLNYIIGIPAVALLFVFGVYLCGRVFGVGFAASLKQANTIKQETKRGSSQ